MSTYGIIGTDRTFGITGTSLCPGEIVAGHTDAVRARQRLAAEDMGMFVATFEPDASTKLHAAIEQRFSAAVAAVEHDIADELYRDIARLRDLDPHMADDDIADRLSEGVA